MKKKLFSLLALMLISVSSAWAVAGEFTLSVGTSEHGTVTFKVEGNSVTAADEGDVVTVEITPATGWAVNQPSGEWGAGIAKAPQRVAGTNIDMLKDFELSPVEGNPNAFTFTMKRANAEISVSYKKLLTNTDITIQDITAVTYNAQAQTPDVVVKDGTTVLSEGIDYTLSYSNNTNAALSTASTNAPTVTVTAVATSDIYAGTATKTFTINPATVTNVMLVESNLVYNEAEQTAVVSVVTAGSISVPTTDYTVSNNKGTTVGNYTATITGQGNFTGSVNANFSIVAANAQMFDITLGTTQFIYDGTAKTPTVTVKIGNTTLVENTDYTITTTNNVNAGTATVSVVGIGNYTGTKNANFTITATTLSNAVVGDIADQVFTTRDIKPDLNVSFGTTPLVKGTDYTVRFTNNVEPGTATATLTGKGNFSGTVSKTFTIVKKELETSMIGNIKVMTYSGQILEPQVSVSYNGVKLVQGTDYTVSYSNNVNICDANAENAPTVTITAVEGNTKYYGSASKTFTIQKKTMQSSMIGFISDMTYTGEALEPSPVVKFNGKTLVEGTDYTVSYENNVNAGTASVIITAVENSEYFDGSASQYFIIKKKSLEASMIADIDTLIYNGSEHKPTPVVTFNGKQLVEGVDYTVSYLNNVNTGMASVYIVAVYGSNFSDFASKVFLIIADRTELNKAIANSEAYYESIKKSNSSIALVLLEAINDAKRVKALDAATQEAVDAATAALNAALQDAKDAVATGIYDIHSTNSENGGVWYDLNGRRVAQPAKGVFIVNGRKVVVK